jgi:hypothetical protein
MSTPFLSGLLSLAEADTEVALIPAAQTFLDALKNAKTGTQRAAALAQLEGNAMVSLASVGPQLLSQVLPVINAKLQSALASAEATVTAATPA